MKNIANRIARLERQNKHADFLIVFANKGENRQTAIERMVQKVSINGPIDDLFVVFLNLHR